MPFYPKIKEKKQTGQKGEKYPLQTTHDKTFKSLMIL